MKAVLLIISLVFSSAISFAQNPAPGATPIPEEQVAKVGKYLAKYVTVLNHPVYLYHWFDSSNRSPYWRSNIGANDPAGLDRLMKGSKTYYQSLCSNNPVVDAADCTKEDVTQMLGRSNVKGPGLYMALDPVITSSYGGSNWVLIQARLPKGFRVLNASFYSSPDTRTSEALPKEVLSNLQSWGCKNISNGYRVSVQDAFYMMLEANMYSKGRYDRFELQTCRAAVRKVLKDYLKIDGFFYPFPSTHFAECVDAYAARTKAKSPVKENPERYSAFVLTNAEKLKPSDVMVFNSQTTDAVEERLRILSQFYAADKDAVTMAEHMRRIVERDHLPKYPGYMILNFDPIQPKCGLDIESGEQMCEVTYQLFSYQSSERKAFTVKLSPQQFTEDLKKTVINSRFPPRKSHHGILWKDLEGKTVDANISSWIEGNLLGCQDIAPMGTIPTLRKGRFYPKSQLN